MTSTSESVADKDFDRAETNLRQMQSVLTGILAIEEALPPGHNRNLEMIFTLVDLCQRLAGEAFEALNECQSAYNHLHRTIVCSQRSYGADDPRLKNA